MSYEFRVITENNMDVLLKAFAYILLTFSAIFGVMVSPLYLGTPWMVPLAGAIALFFFARVFLPLVRFP